MWIHTGKATTKNVSLMVYLKCWEAWDTTCGHKAKDISLHLSRGGKNCPSALWRNIEPTLYTLRQYVLLIVHITELCESSQPISARPSWCFQAFHILCIHPIVLLINKNHFCFVFLLLNVSQPFLCMSFLSLSQPLASIIAMEVVYSIGVHVKRKWRSAGLSLFSALSKRKI